MKKSQKALLCLVLPLALVLALSACGGDKAAPDFNAAAYVQGEIEALYHGNASATYRAAVGLTEDAATAAYEQNLALEVDAFCKTMGIDYPTDALNARLGRTYKDIWEKISCTVGAADPLPNGGYRVAVSVCPLDIMQQLYKAQPAFATEFMKRYADVDTENMTDAAYKTWYEETFDRAYGVGITDLLESLLPNMTAGAPQSLSLRVERTEGGSYLLNKDDFAALDRLLVDYHDPNAVITPEMKPPQPLPTRTPTPTAAPPVPTATAVP